MRHIRNSLTIYSPLFRQRLLSLLALSIARVGDDRLVWATPIKASLNRFRLHRMGRPQRAVAFFGCPRGLRLSKCGGGNMATALVDLYGGSNFEPFDRIILPEGYSPSVDEEFMLQWPTRLAVT